MLPWGTQVLTGAKWWRWYTDFDWEDAMLSEMLFVYPHFVNVEFICDELMWWLRSGLFSYYFLIVDSLAILSFNARPENARLFQGTNEANFVEYVLHYYYYWMTIKRLTKADGSTKRQYCGQEKKKSKIANSGFSHEKRGKLHRGPFENMIKAQNIDVSAVQNWPKKKGGGELRLRHPGIAEPRGTSRRSSEDCVTIIPFSPLPPPPRKQPFINPWTDLHFHHSAHASSNEACRKLHNGEWNGCPKPGIRIIFIMKKRKLPAKALSLPADRSPPL